MSRELTPSIVVSIGELPAFKGQLEQRPFDLNDNRLSGDPVPENEIWEVTNVFAFTGAAAGSLQISVMIYGETSSRGLKRVATSQLLEWSGRAILKEGDYIRCTFANAGACSMSVLGIKRYTRTGFQQEIIDMIKELQKQFPVQLPPDIQEPEIAIDPRM